MQQDSTNKTCVNCRHLLKSQLVCDVCLLKPDESINRFTNTNQVEPQTGDLVIRIPIEQLPTVMPLPNFRHYIWINGQWMEEDNHHQQIELHHWLKRQFQGIPEGNVYFISNSRSIASFDLTFKTADSQICELKMNLGILININSFLSTDFIRYRLLTSELISRLIKKHCSNMLLQFLSDKTTDNFAQQSQQHIAAIQSQLTTYFSELRNKLHWPFSIQFDVQSITGQNDEPLLSTETITQVTQSQIEHRKTLKDLAVDEIKYHHAADDELQQDLHQYQLKTERRNRALQIEKQQTQHIINAKKREEQKEQDQHDIEQIQKWLKIKDAKKNSKL